jgi:hypothetical protein
MILVALVAAGSTIIANSYQWLAGDSFVKEVGFYDDPFSTMVNLTVLAVACSWLVARRTRRYGDAPVSDPTPGHESTGQRLTGPEHREAPSKGPGD